MNEIIQQKVDEMGLVNCENESLIEGEMLSYFDLLDNPRRCVYKGTIANGRCKVKDWLNNKYYYLQKKDLWKKNKMNEIIQQKEYKTFDEVIDRAKNIKTKFKYLGDYLR